MRDPRVDREPVRRRRRRARADSRHRGVSGQRASRTRSRSCSATPRLVAKYRDGVFVTLRLKSNMYHRFHAPCDARVREVVYVSGDTWNVNPIALKRIERLYCKNERAIIDLDLGRPAGLLLVPVAAILVASIRLHCLPAPLKLTYRGPNRLPCDAAYAKGDEMGWFEHGSTILVFATRALRALRQRPRGQPSSRWAGLSSENCETRRHFRAHGTDVIVSSQSVPTMSARSVSAACGSDE